MKFKEALDRIRQVAETLPDDDPDKQEMLNTEGDYSDLMEWALVKRNEYVEQEVAAKELASKYTDRAKSFSRRADSMKDIIKIIMNSAGERSYKGVAGTVSIKAVAAKPIVSDESLIPDEYFQTKKTLDKSAINKAVKEGKEINGVTMDNGCETIVIRV